MWMGCRMWVLLSILGKAITARWTAPQVRSTGPCMGAAYDACLADMSGLPSGVPTSDEVP